MFEPPTNAILFPDVLRRGGFPIPRDGMRFGTRRLLGPGNPLSDKGSGENVDSLESHSENDGLCNGGSFPLICIMFLESLNPYSESSGLFTFSFAEINPRLTVKFCG